MYTTVHPKTKRPSPCCAHPGQGLIPQCGSCWGSSRWGRDLAPREDFSLASAQTVSSPLPQPVLRPLVCLPDECQVASILVPGPEKTA